MRATVAVAILGAALLAGCTSQDTNINFNPSLTGCAGVDDTKITIPGKESDKKLSSGSIMYFEILLDTKVDSKKDATNQPDISPELSIPLP